MTWLSRANGQPLFRTLYTTLGEHEYAHPIGQKVFYLFMKLYDLAYEKIARVFIFIIIRPVSYFYYTHFPI